MVDVRTEIRIYKPVDQVAEFASNPDYAPMWYKNIVWSEWKSPKPLKIGSLIEFKAKFMGKELVYTYEVKEYEAGKKMVMATSEGPFPMETTYEFEAADSHSSIMKLRNTGEPSGFSKIFQPLMSKMMKKANKKDLEKIKDILEHK